MPRSSVRSRVIFEVLSARLGVMRIDLAADAPDVPVQWFVNNCRAKYKRWAADIGRNEYTRMATLGAAPIG